jgi:hypothetical protein
LYRIAGSTRAEAVVVEKWLKRFRLFDQDVVWLHVKMHDLLRMKELERLQKFFSDYLDLFQIDLKRFLREKLS